MVVILLKVRAIACNDRTVGSAVDRAPRLRHADHYAIPFYEIKGLTKKIKCAFADLFMCPRSASKASSLKTDEIEES